MPWTDLHELALLDQINQFNIQLHLDDINTVGKLLFLSLSFTLSLSHSLALFFFFFFLSLLHTHSLTQSLSLSLSPVEEGEWFHGTQIYKYLTPLHVALIKGNRQASLFLIASGADITLEFRCIEGGTSLANYAQCFAS